MAKILGRNMLEIRETQREVLKLPSETCGLQRVDGRVRTQPVGRDSFAPLKIRNDTRDNRLAPFLLNPN